MKRSAAPGARVLVTGCGGFIGSHLVPALVESGYAVSGTAAISETISLPAIRIFPVDIAAGDGLPEAVAGADAVIHLAARNHVIRDTSCDPLAEYRRVNARGTRNVVREAARAGVRTFIHMSSVKAMGEGSGTVLDERFVPAPETPYGISKLEAEEAVIEEAGNAGMRAVILRLPMVYGPRNRGNLPRMIRWASRGLPFPLLQPENLRSMIYVENVVAGILAALRKAPAGVSTFILKDPEDRSSGSLHAAICRELGKRPRFIHVPPSAVRLLGRFSEDFRKVTDSFRVSCEKAEKTIGYAPAVSFEEGIARTVAWQNRSS